MCEHLCQWSLQLHTYSVRKRMIRNENFHCYIIEFKSVTSSSIRTFAGLVTFGDVLYSEGHSWTEWGHDSCVSRGRGNIWADISSDGGLPEPQITCQREAALLLGETFSLMFAQLLTGRMNWINLRIVYFASFDSLPSTMTTVSLSCISFLCFWNATTRTSHKGSVAVAKCALTFKRSLLFMAHWDPSCMIGQVICITITPVNARSSLHVAVAAFL